MPIASTDEQLALQASIRDWAKRAGPDRARPAAWSRAWTRQPGRVARTAGGPGAAAAEATCWGGLAGAG